MKPVPGCQWVTDHLLVRTRKAAKLALPQVLLRAASNVGVACVVNLLSKAEYLASGEDAAFDPVARVPTIHSGPLRKVQPPPSMSYIFWPGSGCLPTARQVRQAIDWIEDAHALGLRVLLNGAGHPARAAVVAGCWRARMGYEDGDRGASRLDWLSRVPATDSTFGLPYDLSAAERTFVAEWPTGREGQPELADMTWSERDEVFPFASIEHWLRVLPTVRFYPRGRQDGCWIDLPVRERSRLNDGADIDLTLADLRAGTWIGERTLRLLDNAAVVFVSGVR